VALLLLPVLLLAGCGDDSGAEPTSGTSSQGEVTDLQDVEVTGGFGEKPTVDLGGRFTAEQTSSRLLVTGEGAPTEAGQAVRIDYSIVDGDSGEELSSSFGQDPQYLLLDPAAVIQPFVDGLTGVPAGSRVLLAVPPQPAPTPTDATASPSPTETPQQTLVFVIDVQKAFPGRAVGTPVAPPPGLPAVTLAEKGQPSVALPGTEAPAELLVQPLITGAGPAVAPGQTVTAMYSGLKWADGAQFDTTWQELIPRDFPIGVGGVIPAWDIALVGQPIGSQVLIVVPPAQGYGEQGNPNAGITGTDTLVFVVDILDAR
jgi:peptidylprolyl isomerase